MKQLLKVLSLALCVSMSFARAGAQCPPPCTSYNESPVNIVTANTRVCPNEPLRVHFAAVPTKFMVANDPAHHNVFITPEGVNDNIALFNGSEYKLKEIHAHATAEHALNGTRSAYELHFVFALTKGNGSPLLVIGMWGSYMAAPMPERYSDPVTTHFITALTEVAKGACNGGKPISVQASLLSYVSSGQLSHYYTYCGSLTTGGFDKSVTWVVCSRPVNAYVDHAINFLISETCPNVIGSARSLQTLEVPVYSVGN